MHFAERTFRDAPGDLVIVSRLRPPAERNGYEKRLFSGVQFGLDGWQRSTARVPAPGAKAPRHPLCPTGGEPGLAEPGI